MNDIQIFLVKEGGMIISATKSIEEVMNMLSKVHQFSKGIGSIIAMLLLFGCAQQDSQKKKKEGKKGPKVTKAVATIQPAEGEEVRGTVIFSKTDEGVEVQAQLSNLPQGKNGFHIHEYGDCSDLKGFSSAGGHFNPTDQPHGSPTAKQRHVGDMGNIPADSEGKGQLTYTDNIITLNGKHNIVGRAVILHAGEDDLESQPSGAAGGRIGCGVIGIAETRPDTASDGKGMY